MELTLQISNPYPNHWYVTDENYDGPGAIQGSGSTEEEAIQDYYDQIEAEA